MEQIIQYIKPEMLVLIPVLYFIGTWIAKSETSNKFIPFILGACGVVLCGVYVFATSTLNSSQDVAMALFTAIVQGILVAGCSTYANELIKQSRK